MSRTVTYNYNGEEIDSTAWDDVKPDVFKDIPDEIWVEGDEMMEEFKDPKMSCRETVLEEAKRCICTDRQNQYGPPENSFNYISELWTVYLQNDRRMADISISPTDVAIMMILLKVARTAQHKSYSDNYVDMAGYAALAAELAAEEAIDELCK